MSRLVKVALVPRRRQATRQRLVGKAPCGNAVTATKRGDRRGSRRGEPLGAHSGAVGAVGGTKGRRRAAKRKRVLAVGRTARSAAKRWASYRLGEVGAATGERPVRAPDAIPGAILSGRSKRGAVQRRSRDEARREKDDGRSVSGRATLTGGVIVKGILDQKTRLWRRYRKTRSYKLRNLLAESYLPLVQAMADRIAARLPASVDRSDLVGAGVFGLLKAIEGFDPERGTRFESYCQVRVRGAIVDELRRQDWLSRPSRHRGISVSRARSRLAERLGREPFQRELADHLGISLNELRAREVESSAARLVSLDSGIPEGKGRRDGTGLIDIEDPQELPAEVAHRRELIGLIERNLTGIERVIVVLHYHENMKLKQVARVLKRSNSRITQIHNRLLSRLKERLSLESV